MKIKEALSVRTGIKDDRYLTWDDVGSIAAVVLGALIGVIVVWLGGG